MALTHRQIVKQVNIHQAKAQFSRLIEEAAAGEEIIIAKVGKPVARLVALDRGRGPRQPGRFKGLIKIADDFDAPVEPDLARAFGIK